MIIVSGCLPLAYACVDDNTVAMNICDDTNDPDCQYAVFQAVCDKFIYHLEIVVAKVYAFETCGQRLHRIQHIVADEVHHHTAQRVILVRNPIMPRIQWHESSATLDSDVDDGRDHSSSDSDRQISE